MFANTTRPKFQLPICASKTVGLRFDGERRIEIIEHGGEVMESLDFNECEKSISAYYKDMHESIRDYGVNFTPWHVALYRYASRAYGADWQWTINPNPFVKNEWIATGILA